MKRWQLFLPLAVFAVMGVLLIRGLQLDPTAMPSALVGNPLPEFSLPLLDQPARSLNRADVVGEPMLLNVWATWCPTCVVEHPYLMYLAQELNLYIVGLDYKDDRPAALAWLEKRGNPYRHTLFDEKGSLGLDLGVFGAPETYLIDHHGVVRYRYVGAVDEKAWTEQLKPRYDELVLQARQGG